jgi:hypothetical protein
MAIIATLLFILVLALVPAFRRFLLWIVLLAAVLIGIGAMQGSHVSPLLAQVLFIGFLTTPLWLVGLIVAKGFVKRRALKAAKAAQVQRAQKYGAFKAKAR